MELAYWSSDFFISCNWFACSYLTVSLSKCTTPSFHKTAQNQCLRLITESCAAKTNIWTLLFFKASLPRGQSCLALKKKIWFVIMSLKFSGESLVFLFLKAFFFQKTVQTTSCQSNSWLVFFAGFPRITLSCKKCVKKLDKSQQTFFKYREFKTYSY